MREWTQGSKGGGKGKAIALAWLAHAKGLGKSQGSRPKECEGTPKDAKPKNKKEASKDLSAGNEEKVKEKKEKNEFKKGTQKRKPEEADVPSTKKSKKSKAEQVEQEPVEVPEDPEVTTKKEKKAKKAKQATLALEDQPDDKTPVNKRTNRVLDLDTPEEENEDSQLETPKRMALGLMKDEDWDRVAKIKKQEEQEWADEAEKKKESKAKKVTWTDEPKETKKLQGSVDGSKCVRLRTKSRDFDKDEHHVRGLSDEERQKIREMSNKDMPIEERRVLYNALGRRMANPVGLSPGGESYRGGTRTSAKGAVTSSAAKKALGTMLDTSVAELATTHGKDSGKATAKAKAKGQAKAKATAKLSGPEEKAKKDLLKDIKAFFCAKRLALAAAKAKAKAKGKTVPDEEQEEEEEEEGWDEDYWNNDEDWDGVGWHGDEEGDERDELGQSAINDLVDDLFQKLAQGDQDFIAALFELKRSLVSASQGGSRRAQWHLQRSARSLQQIPVDRYLLVKAIVLGIHPVLFSKRALEHYAVAVSLRRTYQPEKTKVEANEDPVECTANVLLPHEVFGALHKRDRKQVREGINKTVAEVIAWLCWFGFKADLKARYQCHLLSEYYKCKKMCDRCSAIQPMTSQPHPMTYKNMSDDAPYAGTCKDHDDYVRTARRLTPWLAVEGFQFEHITFDMMHLVFLGVARNHVPSVLKMLKRFGFHYEEAESDEKFLKRVSMEMKQDCKDHGLPRKTQLSAVFLFYFVVIWWIMTFACLCDFPKVRLYLPRRLLTVSNCGSFGQDDYCELGSRFKAQHVKTMVWWIAQKVQEVTKDSDAYAPVMSCRIHSKLRCR
eukprot:s710_g3.t1